MTLLLAVWLVTFVAGVVLEALQARYLARHGGRVPPELEGAVDAAILRRTTAYARDRSQLRVVRSTVTSAALGWLLFGGGLPLLDAMIRRGGSPDRTTSDLLWVARASLGLDPHFEQALLQGILVVMVLVVLGSLLELPFAWWDDFRIEARYGFNRSTPGLWIADRIKALLLALVLGITVSTVATALVWWSPHLWWLWVWGFSVAFSILLLLIAPTVVEPLFFKFRPVTEPGLEQRLRGLATRAGLHIGQVLQVDASRRSRHSNAYFTGLGRVKRIVLFDTLLETHRPEEIEAVLAHEIGHWKLRHVSKRLVAQAAAMFAALWIAGYLARWPGLSELVSMHDMAFPVRILLLGSVASFLGLPLSPLVSGLSRRDERQADRYACRLTGHPGELASALQRLARNNLSNLYPHPLYAWFFASHPPVLERIRTLRAVPDSTGVTA